MLMLLMLDRRRDGLSSSTHHILSEVYNFPELLEYPQLDVLEGPPHLEGKAPGGRRGTPPGSHDDMKPGGQAQWATERSALDLENRSKHAASRPLLCRKTGDGRFNFEINTLSVLSNWKLWPLMALSLVVSSWWDSQLGIIAVMEWHLGLYWLAVAPNR